MKLNSIKQYKIIHKGCDIIREYENISIDNKEILVTQTNTEIIIGLVGAVGIQTNLVVGALELELKKFDYTIYEIKISKDVIPKKFIENDFSDEYERVNFLMDKGNEIRSDFNNGILAIGAVEKILNYREKNKKKLEPIKKIAFIINSLKHPNEVEIFRDIYPNGFYLLGIYADENQRLNYLIKRKNILEENAKKLIERDTDENIEHGQHTRKVFEKSDFFIEQKDSTNRLNNDILRILDLIFGHPYITPTFNEFAMYMAFISALRSADLSRQVGAVIAKDNEIIALGANDCPKFGGGLYWPFYSEKEESIIDIENGRDYKRGEDSNKIKQKEIIDDIVDKLQNESSLDLSNDKIEAIKYIIKISKIKDLTEYGRCVHAEMEALMMCARNNISTKEATLYCTTFPCHNCAKHIIDSGIKKVYYIEPYPKSKAFEFHNESITEDDKDINKVQFLPFVGVGPRLFFDLFSVSLSSGYKITRKNEDGKTLKIDRKKLIIRLPMIPYTYLDSEKKAIEKNTKFFEEEGNYEK